MQGQALELAIEHAAAGGDVELAIGVLEPVAHLVAGAARVQEAVVRAEPVAARFGDLAGEDLDAVAAGRLVGERHDAAVDLGPAATMADVGVDDVGEIEHRGPFRQVDHLALRGQQVDPVLDDIGAECGEQGRVVLLLVAPFEQLAHPGDLALEARVGAAAFLVAPVRGKAEFGIGVHVVGADLHLEGAALGADHGGVQGLVIVSLRAGDVVVEFAGDERPQRMHDAERRVAGRHVADQYAQGADVVELGKVEALLLHLPPDRTDVFGPAGDIGFDAGLIEGLAQGRRRAGDPGLAVVAAFVEQFGDLPIGLRLQVAEREVFELPLELPDTKPVGQRGVDVGGQLGQSATVVLVELGRIAHHHELAREQDEDDAQVANDGQQQTPQALGGAGTGADRIQRPDLAGRALALDQVDYLVAEDLQFGRRELTTGLHGLVQQQCTLRVRPGRQLVEFGEDRLAHRFACKPARARIVRAGKFAVDPGERVGGRVGHRWAHGRGRV